MITNFNTNFLVVWIFRVIPVKFGHGHFGQNQNKKIIPRLKMRVCHKSVTHPFLFFSFSQIRNL